MKLLKLTTLLIAAILAVVTAPARADNYTWDGDIDGNWDTTSGVQPSATTNWTPDIGLSNPIPGSNDKVFFNGPAPFTTIELDGNRSVLSVNFSGDTNYTLTETAATNTLKLVDGDINAFGTATHTISSKVQLDADGVWAIHDSSTLTVSGVISGGYFLQKTGDGTLTLTGTNTYTGGTTIEQGVLRISSDSSLGAHSGAITLDNATLMNNNSTVNLHADRDVVLVGVWGAIRAGWAHKNITVSGRSPGAASCASPMTPVR